jgi:toxin CcdB
MAQFMVYENQNQDSKQMYPYFVDVQNALLESLSSRLVIPLTSCKHLDNSAISMLCPKVVIEGMDFVLLTHQMTNIPSSALKVPIISVEFLRDEIVAALDFLVTGV